jgi:type IV pilus assembly protein PilC
MPRFEYIALDAKGTESRGVVEATTQNDVVTQLRSSGYFPTSVVPEGQGPKPAKGAKAKVAKGIVPVGQKKKGVTFFQRKTVKSKVLMIFTRQLATLIDAGLPLLKGLGVLAKQEKDLVLRGAINSMSDSVQGGSTFSESMGQHPRIFNRLYVSMVKAGEIGGVLELVLQRLAEFQEKAQKIKNKVKSAMTYPVVVLVIALIIMFFLLTTIVPKFAQIFKDMLGENSQLPALTLGVMAASDFLQHMFIPPRLYYTLLGAFLIGLGWWSLNNTERGRNGFDRFKLRMPVFGDILRKSAIARFSRTLGTLVTSGVPILQALNITKETAGNVVLADAIMKVHDAVKEGESIVAPLEASGVFPPMVISMVDVGEETGQLPDMLLKVAEVYDDEVDNAVESLTALLEPIMIVFLAVIVGTIVIALFLPLIEIIKRMQGGQGSGSGGG